MLQAPPYPRRPIGRVRDRAQNRLAANSRRYRLRQARGQEVYGLTANSAQLLSHLIRKGKLRDGVIYDHAAIELALAHWLADEIDQ
jgi:hypothetical protein